MTVPHKNVNVIDKHYQHFNSDMLEKLLVPYFDNIKYIFFDIISSKIIGLLQRLIGGKGDFFILTNKKVLTLFYNIYINHYLYTNDEKKAGRIAVICQKK